MKYYYLKRFSIGFLGNLFAGCIGLVIAILLIQSVVTVSFLEEDKTYQVDALEVSGIDFMDSEIFTDIFTHSAVDVLHYIATANLLENEQGEFDKEREFDVMRYAYSKGMSSSDAFSVYYSLDSLIKWGKQGINHKVRYFGLSDFADYYKADKRSNAVSVFDAKEYLDYLVMQFPEDISYIVSDDGVTTITMNMLVCNYRNVHGQMELTEMVSSWEDYFLLKNSLILTCNDLAREYDIYKLGNKSFTDKVSNLKYLVRLQDDITYTNVEEYAEFTEEGLTEVVSENREYFILFQQTMEYTGLSDVVDQDIYQALRQYDNVYPDNTKVWMYVDSDFTAKADAFSNAKSLFQNNYSLSRQLYILGIFLIAGWIVLFGYLALTTGVSVGRNGSESIFLYWFDRLWTEIIIACFVLMYVGATYLVDYLRRQTSVYNIALMNLSEISSAEILLFIQFFMTGFLYSFGVVVLGFSLIRRYRARVLFRGSLLHFFSKLWHLIVNYVETNKSAVVNTLIPYNLFVLLNVLGAFLFAIYVVKYPIQSSVILVVLLLLDAYVGVRLFRQGMERKEIVEGVSRIKAGEVDSRLDTSHLEGMNLYLADAVNTIGEGIATAVENSMRDEQMKTDLITNVSHDLKTPLTSIINYVDLLKKCSTMDDTALGYLKVLDDKSRRLKQLLEDLLEASKLSSGNVELNCEKINLVELASQSLAEFEDRFEEKQLSIVFTPQEKLYIFADSRMLWRIMDNLLTNVCKYSMDNTRVYLTMEHYDYDKIRMEIKNISSQQSKYQGAELTERFIRGDASRTTEGSGLGLFIAKSLTSLQGGTFEVSMDGDLFKAILVFDEF